MKTETLVRMATDSMEEFLQIERENFSPGQPVTIVIPMDAAFDHATPEEIARGVQAFNEGAQASGFSIAAARHADQPPDGAPSFYMEILPPEKRARRGAGKGARLAFHASDLGTAHDALHEVTVKAVAAAKRLDTARGDRPLS